MRYQEGQGIFGKIAFKDGNYPQYERPYLIVEVGNDYIDVLNISSLQGKEKKLAFKTNKKIQKYRPPFLKPSFVKLDSLKRVYTYDSDWGNFKLLDNGKKLDSNEFSEIKSKIIRN